MKDSLYQRWLRYVHRQKEHLRPYVGYLTYKNHFNAQA